MAKTIADETAANKPSPTTLIVNDFVRLVTVEQARPEVEGAKNNVIVMTPDEQLAFWNALNDTPVLTESQKRLGATMRGEL